MKKLFSVLLLCLVLPFSLFMVGCGDEKSSQPKSWAEMATEVPGSFLNEISITSAKELAWVAKQVNSGNDFSGMVVKLEVNLNLKNLLWTPIGSGTVDELGNVSGKAFAGVFDGQNHTISNLYTKGEIGVGLFGLVTGNVKNLRVVNAEVYWNDSVGVIAGAAYSSNLMNEVAISNCSVENIELNAKYVNEHNDGSNVGSIVGVAYNVSVVNCAVKTAYVAANCNAGQVVGAIYYAEFEEGNTISNVEVVYNQTGVGDFAGTNINHTLAGKVVL